MAVIKTNIEWIDELLPEGFPTKTSTIITGPGGSGKPLIGETFVSGWLKEGGSIAFMSLQYPSTDFISGSIKELTGLDLNDYRDHVIFFQLDVTIENIVEESDKIIRANLVKPEVWDKSLALAKTKLPSTGPGILFFASALNLLLFSPTYGESVLMKIKNIITEDKSVTYIFSVSTTAKKTEIAILEEAADNLIMSRSEKKPFQLFMEIIRMKEVSFNKNEIQIPIKLEVLKHIKGIADHSRSKVIPEISKI